MKRIFVPTQAPSDWQRLLAKPTLHWKKSYSAMTTAACWEDACDHLPAEIKETLDASGQSDLVGLKLLAAIPEWEVELRRGVQGTPPYRLVRCRHARWLCVNAKKAHADSRWNPLCASYSFCASTRDSSWPFPPSWGVITPVSTGHGRSVVLRRST